MKLVWELSCLALNRLVTCNTHDKSITTQAVSGSYKANDEKKFTLEIAYRTSLRHDLEERRITAKRYRSFGNALEAEKEKISRRSEIIDRKAQLWGQKPLSESLLSRLETHLKTEWEGDTAWADILLHGDQHRPISSSLVQQPFDQVWSHVERGYAVGDESQGTQSLLQSLESKLKEQQTRLGNWKSIQADLAAASATPKNTPFKTPAKTPMRFAAKTPARTPSRFNERSNTTPLHRRALSTGINPRAHVPVLDSVSTSCDKTPRIADSKAAALQRISSLRQPQMSSTEASVWKTDDASKDCNARIPPGRSSSLRVPSNYSRATNTDNSTNGESGTTLERPQPRPSYQRHGRVGSTPVLAKPGVESRLPEVSTPQRLSSLRRPSRINSKENTAALRNVEIIKIEQTPSDRHDESATDILGARSNSTLHDPDGEAVSDLNRLKVSSMMPRHLASTEEDEDLETLEMELPSQIFSPPHLSMRPIVGSSQEPPADQQGAQSRSIKPSLPFLQPEPSSKIMPNTIPKPVQLSLAERTRASMASLSPTKEKANPFEASNAKSPLDDTTNIKPTPRNHNESLTTTATITDRTRQSLAKPSPSKERSNPLDYPNPLLHTTNPLSTSSHPAINDLHSALQVRTRLSMLESAAKAPQRRASLRKATRLSRQYPVNQWDDGEAPGVGKLGSVAEGEHTAKHFEEMDYASAFASRPKVGTGLSSEVDHERRMSLETELEAFDEENAFLSRPKIGLGSATEIAVGEEGVKFF